MLSNLIVEFLAIAACLLPSRSQIDGPVYVVAAYQGYVKPVAAPMAPLPRNVIRERHRRGPDRTNEPPGEVTVKVHKGKLPIILVVTAYRPINWKIEAEPGALARVIVSSYHPQTVEGIDAKIPVSTLCTVAGDKNAFHACRATAPSTGHPKLDAYAKEKFTRLVKRVKEMTGQEIARFQGAYTAKEFEVP
jgi:hypothetical protein